MRSRHVIQIKNGRKHLVLYPFNQSNSFAINHDYDNVCSDKVERKQKKHLFEKNYNVILPLNCNIPKLQKGTFIIEHFVHPKKMIKRSAQIAKAIIAHASIVKLTRFAPDLCPHYIISILTCGESWANPIPKQEETNLGRTQVSCVLTVKI